MQDNWRDDDGTARGRLYFQTFSDFPLGLSAADNLSPFGRSNIQTIQASEGAGPNGELQAHYRSYYGAPFLQDDLKVNSPFHSEPGPALGIYRTRARHQRHHREHVAIPLLQQMPVPPASGTFIGNTVAADDNPARDQPVHGTTFWGPPTGVFQSAPLRASTRRRTPLDSFAPRFGFAWQPSVPGLAADRIAVRGGYGWFYQSPPYSANASGTPLFTSAPFAEGFSNSDSSNNLSSLPTSRSRDDPRLHPSHTDVTLSDRVAGSRIPDPETPAMESEHASAGCQRASRST